MKTKRWNILFEYLLLNTHRFSTVDEIRELLWPGDDNITYSRVTNTIARLASKLEETNDDWQIAAVRNVGYFLYASEMVTARPVRLFKSKKQQREALYPTTGK